MQFARHAVFRDPAGHLVGVSREIRGVRNVKQVAAASGRELR